MLNDNDSSMQDVAPSRTDPHGRAALLLVESLIHGLCSDQSLSVVKAVEIVQRAVDVQREEAELAEEAGAPLWRSHTLLSAIAASLKIDAPHGPPFPHLVT